MVNGGWRSFLLFDLDNTGPLVPAHKLVALVLEVRALSHRQPALRVGLGIWVELLRRLVVASILFGLGFLRQCRTKK